MKDFIFREITQLQADDCFMIFSRTKSTFDYPVHTHTELELNFLENAAGCRRVVGDSVEDIDDLELALIGGPNIEHAWLNHNNKSADIHEITIHFHGDLFNEQLLQKNQFHTVREMFDKAAYGVVFQRETILKIKPQLNDLASEPEGAHSVLNFFSILCDLSLSPMRMLSSHSFKKENEERYDSRRIEKTYNYLYKNFDKEVHLSDLANVAGMSEGAFSRFIKQRTGRSFIDSLNDIRLGHATRMLVDTTHSIAEISMQCGFNNLSNFNRIFKKKKGCTPHEFRENYKEAKYYV